LSDPEFVTGGSVEGSPLAANWLTPAKFSKTGPYVLLVKLGCVIVFCYCRADRASLDSTVMLSPRWVWILFGSCLLIALIFLAYPLYVIRPFRPQHSSELAVALTMMRVRPWVAGICFSGALTTLLLYWRNKLKRAVRIASASAVAVTGLMAGLSVVNVYEVMFHSAGRPAFEPVAGSKLGTDEMVLAVRTGGVARAYPVRAISYHHIVNDEVAGVPIVATY
jgi:Protein of unknown function (DUF3179)